jgi:hypothetical protein
LNSAKNHSLSLSCLLRHVSVPLEIRTPLAYVLRRAPHSRCPALTTLRIHPIIARNFGQRDRALSCFL